MSNEFRVGVASVDISPDRPELLEVAGLHRAAPTRGVLPGFELAVDAMAFEVGGRRAVVATRDTGGYGTGSERDNRKAIAEATGIEETMVIITGRHTHSYASRPKDRDNPESVAANAERWKKINPGTIAACVQALENLRPAEIASATVSLAEPIGQNRRMRYAHGGSSPAWGSGPVAVPGEKFAGPAGPDSTRIDFLVAREPGSEQPFGILTSYGTHIHLSGIPYFSSESVGGVKHALQRRVPGLTVVYGLATAGDLDIHFTHPIPSGGIEAEVAWFRESAREVGRRFSEAVVPAIERATYVRPTELRHEIFEVTDHKTDRRKRGMLLNALALGDTAIVSIPAEMFIELVNQMRESSPFAQTLLLGFNGSPWLGYVGTPLAYEQGGYEVGRGPAPSPEEEERLIAAGVKQRTLGQARTDTGVEIAVKVSEMLRHLAG